MNAEASWSAPIRIAAGAVFCTTAALYLATTSRSVGFIDRGELAAVAATLGIAHPTGYPTLTLLGHLVTRLVPGSAVLALNAFAALLVAVGSALLVPLYARALAGRPSPGHRSGSARPPRPAQPARTSAAVPGTEPQRAALAAGAALVVGVAPIWWRQANGFEAYALHALMLPLMLLQYLRWIEAEGAPTGRDAATGSRPGRRAFVFAVVLGLAFTNHLTTMLVLPALLVHALTTVRPSLLARRLAPLAAGGALGLLPYLYLPLRTAQHPRFAWGAANTLDGFVAHLTGWQYRVWMFTSWDTFRVQAGWFFTVLPGEFAWAGAVLVLAGAAWLAMRRPRLAVFAALLFAATILYASNYEIHDIESYYMLAILALGLALAAGLGGLAERVGARLAIAAAAALFVLSVAIHWKSCDESRNTLPYDYTHHLLAGLPERAVVLSTQWDYFVSPSYVVQALEGVRPDVTVLDPELLRRSWYVRGIERRAPDLFAAARPALEHFLREVRPFEAGRPFDPGVVDAAYVGMVDALVEAAGPARPVLVTPDVDRRFGARFERVPLRLALLLVSNAAYVPQEFPAWRFRPWRGALDERVVTTHRLYAQALVSRAAYEEAHGDGALARRYGEYAETFDPRIDPARIPPLPLGGREGVLERLRFFARIRDQLRRGPPAPAGPGEGVEPQRPIP